MAEMLAEQEGCGVPFESRVLLHKPRWMKGDEERG